MNKVKVKVLSAKPKSRRRRVADRQGNRLGSAAMAALIRPRALIASGIAATLLLVGTPHIGWEYGCSHPMKGPGSCRVVSWCAYYGVQGRRTERPEYGTRCQLVTLLPLDWDKMLGGS